MEITKFSKYGVPILSNQEIDEHAYHLLNIFDDKIISNVQKTYITRLADFLKNNFKLSYQLTNLPLINNSKILGKTNLKDGSITIETDLVNDEKRYNFTFAHEIGHFWLHRHKEIAFEEDDKSIEEIIDDQNNLNIFTKSKTEIRSRDWLEMHANKFAASLLLPEESFKKAFEYFQYNSLDIRKNLGKVIINDDFNNSYDKLVFLLSNHFATSKIAVEYRINNLNMIINNQGIKHISEIFKS